MEIYTFGHSLRSMAELTDVLDAHRIGFVADIRRFPGERKHPGFGQEALDRACLERGVTCVSLGRQLGGGRSEGYRAYIGTDSFRLGLDELLDLARRRPTMILCREAFYFRCHRKYLADELERSGWAVLHLLDAERRFRHRVGSYRMSSQLDVCE